MASIARDSALVLHLAVLSCISIAQSCRTTLLRYFGAQCAHNTGSHLLPPDIALAATPLARSTTPPAIDQPAARPPRIRGCTPIRPKNRGRNGVTQPKAGCFLSTARSASATDRSRAKSHLVRCTESARSQLLCTRTDIPVLHHSARWVHWTRSNDDESALPAGCRSLSFPGPAIDRS